jgi:cell division inhibitor SulA/protein ImuA
MVARLPTLPHHANLWRPGHRPLLPAPAGLASGHAGLDQVLHGGGWPGAALTELLLASPGSGELPLLQPLLAALSRQSRWLVWIDPPFTPYAPALQRAGIDLQRLLLVRPPQPSALVWACEQSLRSPGCAAVLCWSGRQPLRYPELRKLQVAAAEGGRPAFLFRHPRAAAQASPAALRLRLEPTAEGLALEVLKQRGANAGQHLLLPPSPLARARPAFADWPVEPPPAATPAEPRGIVSTLSRERSSP